MLLLLKTSIFLAISICVTVKHFKFVQALDTNLELEDDDFRETFTMLQNINTGYDKGNMSPSVLDGIRDENMKEALKKYFEDNMVCFYMFVATHHQCLTKDVVLTNYYMLNFPDFSFIKQAKTLLLSTYYFTESSFEHMEPFWLIYTYELFLVLVKSRKHSFNPTMVKTIHDRIIATCANFVNNSLKCDPQNKFNGQKQNSLYYGQLKMLQSALIRGRYIIENKYLIDSFFSTNELFQRIDGFYKDRVSYYTLTLQKLVKETHFIGTILYDFFETPNKSDINAIRECYVNMEQQNQPDLWVKALGNFWQQFINVLKYTAVRFLCRYMVNINRTFKGIDNQCNISHFSMLKPISINGFIKMYNEFMLQRLEKFSKLIDLGDDSAFKNVIERIISMQSDKQFLTLENRKHFYDLLIAELQNVPPLFNKIKIDVDFENEQKENAQAKILESIINEHGLTIEAEKKIFHPLINRIMMSMDAYINFLERMLSKVDMRIIRSFIFFTENLNSDDKSIIKQ